MSITINQLGLLCIFVVGAYSQHVGLDDSSNVVVTSEHGVKITGTSVEVNGHDLADTINGHADLATQVGAINASLVAVLAELRGTVSGLSSSFAAETSSRAAAAAADRSNIAALTAVIDAQSSTIAELSGSVIPESEASEAAFCSAWGETLTALTGVDDCRRPTTWRGDLSLRPWMFPLMTALTDINGSLSISGNSHPTRSLRGVFPNLCRITGRLTIQDSALESLDGSFLNLTSVGCHIEIQSNENLVDFGNVFPLLTDMVDSSTHGPRSCQNGALRMVNNIRLISLNNSFASIRHVPGDWYFQGNHRISSFDSAFPELRTVDGQLEILDNDQLVTFGETPFSNFENVQHLYFYGNGGRCRANNGIACSSTNSRLRTFCTGTNGALEKLCNAQRENTQSAGWLCDSVACCAGHC